MSATGLLIPILIIAAFFAAARALRAMGLRPEEQFIIPTPRRITTHA